MTEEVTTTAVDAASPAKSTNAFVEDISWIKTHAFSEAKDLWLSVKKLGPILEHDVEKAFEEISSLAKKLEAHLKTPPAPPAV